MQTESPHILIVGAGAVGQVYGAYLLTGGARVSVLVKPRHRARALEGFPVHRLRWLGPPRTWAFEGLGVFTDVAALKSERFDQVWLCVASDALQDADWLAQLAEVTADATLVSQHGGPQDAARVHAAAGRERVVHGPILLLAYGEPLSDRDRLGTGTRYFLPPVPHAFSSASPARARAVVRALRRGGLWARTGRDAEGTYQRSSAVLIPLMAALELSDWSLARLRRGPWLALAAKAARQCVTHLQATQGRRAPLWLTLCRVATLRAAAWVAPWTVPLPLEAFLRRHFTKVRAQTEIMLEGHASALGTRRDVAVTELLRALRERRRAGAA